MLLTHIQIVEITDYKRPADQIKWLRREGWHFVVGASGRPKVSVEEFQQHMVGKQIKRSTPRLELLNSQG